MPALAVEPGDRARAGSVYTGGFHQLGVQALGPRHGRRVHVQRLVRLPLDLEARLWGIRVDEDVETAGLDVSEHGMWGYPEFYIPVPGGYGTEAHGHLGLSHGHARAAPAAAIVAEPTPEPAG